MNFQPIVPLGCRVYIVRLSRIRGHGDTLIIPDEARPHTLGDLLLLHVGEALTRPCSAQLSAGSRSATTWPQQKNPARAKPECTNIGNVDH